MKETPIRSSTPSWPMQIGEDKRISILTLTEAEYGNVVGFVAFQGKFSGGAAATVPACHHPCGKREHRRITVDNKTFLWTSAFESAKPLAEIRDPQV